jgi:hypothetical protein
VTVRKLAIALTITTAVLAGSSGCSLIGDTLQQKTTTKQNLENQKYVAFRFIKFQPDVEVITFTQEGSIDGSGEWAVNAVVTIGGKEYKQILGMSVGGGDPLPDTPATHAPAPVTVNYSDGTMEVLG